MKKLNKQELFEKIPTMLIKEASEHFGVSLPTIKKVAKMHGLKFKKYKSKGRAGIAFY